MKARCGNRWLAIFSAVGIAAAGLFAQAAVAADFPNRTITLIVGFSPGGSNDITARVISQPLSELLGVPVIVENRVGAAGVISSQHVARSTPDGYTLGVTSASGSGVVVSIAGPRSASRTRGGRRRRLP